VDGIRTHV